MRGELVPGQPLVLREIADDFNVSQTPAREALLLLVSEGVLSMRTGRSVIVPEQSLEDLMELRDIRVELESMSARRACKHVDDALIECLTAYHQEMMIARNSANYKEALSANKKFHLALYERARSPALFKLIQQLWMRTAPYIRYIYYPIPPDYNKPYSRHPHEEIIDSLRARDVKGVGRWIKRDLCQHEKHMATNMLAATKEKAPA